MFKSFSCSFKEQTCTEQKSAEAHRVNILPVLSAELKRWKIREKCEFSRPSLFTKGGVSFHCHQRLSYIWKRQVQLEPINGQWRPVCQTSSELSSPPFFSTLSLPNVTTPLQELIRRYWPICTETSTKGGIIQRDCLDQTWCLRKELVDRLFSQKHF